MGDGITIPRDNRGGNPQLTGFFRASWLTPCWPAWKNASGNAHTPGDHLAAKPGVALDEPQLEPLEIPRTAERSSTLSRSLIHSAARSRRAGRSTSPGKAGGCWAPRNAAALRGEWVGGHRLGRLSRSGSSAFRSRGEGLFLTRGGRWVIRPLCAGAVALHPWAGAPGAVLPAASDLHPVGIQGSRARPSPTSRWMSTRSPNILYSIARRRLGLTPWAGGPGRGRRGRARGS